MMSYYIYIMASSGTDQCAELQPFGDETTDGTSALLNDIKYFQDREMIILEQLQNEAISADRDDAKINKLKNDLQPYQNSRVRLMNQLSNVSSQTQSSLAANRSALQDQLSMMMLAESQLKSIEKETEALINEKNNKQRMVEITNYENDRYSSHKNIFRTIAFCSIFVLAGIYIGATDNSKLSWLGYPIVVTSIVVAIILTLNKIWWNYYRNERNWNKFSWNAPHPKDSKYETVWQHDVKAFEKAWSQAKDEGSYLEQQGGSLLKKAKSEVGEAYDDVLQPVKDAVSKTANSVDNQLAGRKSKKESFSSY